MGKRDAARVRALIPPRVTSPTACLESAPGGGDFIQRSFRSGAHARSSARTHATTHVVSYDHAMYYTILYVCVCALQTTLRHNFQYARHNDAHGK